MIRAISVLPGDRIGIRNNGHSVTRSVIAVGDDYVVVHINSQITKVPEHRISSHIPGSDGSIGRRYGV